MRAKSVSYLVARSVAHLRKSAFRQLISHISEISHRKREHLLAEIRDQAAQIQKLMAQLEMTNGSSQPRSTSGSVRRSSPGTDFLSPLDPSSPSSPKPTVKPDVEEWIAKARESIEAFGGFIGAGGPGMSKAFFVDEDPEDSESSGDGAYEFAVEDADGEPIGSPSVAGQSSRSASRKVRSCSDSSNGSLHRQESNGSSGTQKLAILPSEAAPFGLIAGLALKHRRKKNHPPVEDDDEVGIANEDFFRSMSWYPFQCLKYAYL
jgi:hypothetical protein